MSGTIDGAGRGDVGKELAARASGHSAWTTSKRIPILLIAAGAVVAAAGAAAGIRSRRRRA